MSEATAERTALEIRAEGRVGTICVRGPCVLCGRDFDVQNGESRLVARNRDGDRAGPVCFRCASAGGDELAWRLHSRARRMRNEAAKLEAWAEGAIWIHPDAKDAATAARTGRKEEA